MPRLTWKEISRIVHDIKEERTVICGAMMRLERVDVSLQRIECNLEELINSHRGDDDE